MQASGIITVEPPAYAISENKRIQIEKGYVPADGKRENQAKPIKRNESYLPAIEIKFGKPACPKAHQHGGKDRPDVETKVGDSLTDYSI
jgi:hypothetical protein